MNINTDSLVLFLITWGVPAFLMRRAYLKMDSTDQKSAMADFRSPRFIFSLGFVGLGFFLLHLDSVLSFTLLKITGLCLLTAGGIFSTVSMWKNSKIKSLITFFLISFMVFQAVS